MKYIYTCTECTAQVTNGAKYRNFGKDMPENTSELNYSLENIWYIDTN